MKLRKLLSATLATFVIASSVAASLINKPTVVEAANSTSYTFTYNARVKGFVSSQDCYLPNRTINTLGLSALKDISIDEEDNIILSGTLQTDAYPKGADGVFIYDPVKGEIIEEIIVDGYTSNGVYYQRDLDRLYVAYANKNCVRAYEKDDNGVYTLNTDLGKNGEYQKPDSILFNTATSGEGDDENTNRFDPNKIAVDGSGNLFLVCNSVNEGIVQLSVTGEFLGYFAVNTVIKSFKEKIQDFFDVENSNQAQPPVFTNVFTDKDGLVYTTTSVNKEVAKTYDYVKKHNTAGQNLVPDLMYFNDDSQPTDIWTDDRGVMYVAFNTGHIYVYTAEGGLLCVFGGTSAGNVAGLFQPFTAGKRGLGGIAVDSKGTIWCIDLNGSIISFNMTDYTALIYEAYDYYYGGYYNDSIEVWKKVLELNQMSTLAHNNIGLNYLYSADSDTPERYELAMNHLKIARNREAYSQAFWELRNIWLQNNLVAIIITIVALCVAVFALRKVQAKTHIFDSVIEFNDGVKNSKVAKDLKFEMSFLSKTTDKFYDLKVLRAGNNWSCLAIIVVTFFIFLWYNLGRGFIFQYVESTDVDIVALLAGYFGGIGLLILCNWLVTSIQDGEGNFLAIFRMVAVSLVPWAISMIIVVLFSHIATVNEVFMLSLVELAGIILTLFLFFRGISEIHYYTFKETVVSILLTLLLFAIAILIVLLLMNLSTNLFDFIKGIVQEVARNVTN